MWQRWLLRPVDEVSAARVGLSGNTLERVLVALQTGLAFAIDPTDTRQVNWLTLAVNRRRLLRLMKRVEAFPSWQRLMRERATIDTKHVDFAYLRSLGPDTLGGAYVRMLERNGLDPDFFQPPPEWPADVTYVLQRLRQTHDLMHVLTGLETDIPGEVALQAFVHVQLRQLFSVLVVIFGVLIYAPRYPRMLPMVFRGYQAGFKAARLFVVRWEDLWEQPLQEVRERFNIMNLERRPADVAGVHPVIASFAKRLVGAQDAAEAA